MMKKKKSTSMSWFLIKYMVLMTICVGILFAGAAILLTIVSTPQSGIPEGRKLSGLEGHLLNKDYRYVQRMLLSGREGKIEIVDESGTCLYSSDKVKLNFTRTELLILMSLGDNSVGYQENVGIDDHTEYSQYKIGKDGVYDEQRIIVNGNGEILYSTIDFGKKSLSSTEIQYLSGYTADGLHIRKWGYQTRNGEKRYLIYMGRGKVTDVRITHIKQLIVVTVFLTQLVLVMFLFALRLRERCISCDMRWEIWHRECRSSRWITGAPRNWKHCVRVLTACRGNWLSRSRNGRRWKRSVRLCWRICPMT